MTENMQPRILLYILNSAIVQVLVGSEYVLLFKGETCKSKKWASEEKYINRCMLLANVEKKERFRANKGS